jgi:DNA-binding CsgD family transcriptional regulator
MSVRSVLASLNHERAAPATWGGGVGRGMTHADAAAVAVLSVGVALLMNSEPKDALGYLLVFPIWIVSRDLGLLTGASVAAAALLFVGIAGTTQDAFGPLGLLAHAAVFSGAVAAGAPARQPADSGGTKRPSPLLRLLTARPEIMRKQEALSNRELEILERIATGEKNAEIADRFVISQNTVKSHVSQILKKLSAANRTEAAFRYIELYGPPNGDSTTTDVAVEEEDTAQIGAASALIGTVSAIPAKDKALLRLQDGRDLEVPLLEQMRGRVDTGTSAIAYFDQRDRVVGWYLPAEELGVDLRHWAP